MKIIKLDLTKFVNYFVSTKDTSTQTINKDLLIGIENTLSGVIQGSVEPDIIYGYINATERNTKYPMMGVHPIVISKEPIYSDFIIKTTKILAHKNYTVNTNFYNDNNFSYHPVAGGGGPTIIVATNNYYFNIVSDEDVYLNWFDSGEAFFINNVKRVYEMENRDTDNLASSVSVFPAEEAITLKIN